MGSEITLRLIDGHVEELSGGATSVCILRVIDNKYTISVTTNGHTTELKARDVEVVKP